MNEFENIHAETPVESKELRELIARLTDPMQKDNDHRTRVRDIAETMDIEESKVIATLHAMRLEKLSARKPSKEAEKLAESLTSMQTPFRKKISFAPTRRMIFLSSFFVFVLMLGGFIAVHELVKAEGHTVVRTEATFPRPGR